MTLPSQESTFVSRGSTGRTEPRNVHRVNLTSEAKLVDGYYEVNGFKFSEYYYNRLWSTGRGAPSLVANEVLQNATNVVQVTNKSGFFKYEFGGWEMIYNSTTSEVWHLQPVK